MDYSTLTQKIRADLSAQAMVGRIVSDLQKGLRPVVEGVDHPVTAFWLYELSRALKRGALVVVFPTLDELRQVKSDLDQAKIAYSIFPATGRSLYSHLIDKSINTIEQLHVLHSFISEKQGAILLCTLRAFCSPVRRIDQITGESMTLTAGMSLDPTRIADTLASGGYERVPRTTIQGEFSIRGEVIDIFPYEEERPLRIFMEFDSIEHLMFFDPLTQDSTGSIQEFSLYTGYGQQENDFSFITEYIDSKDTLLFAGSSGITSAHSALLKEANSEFSTVFHEHPEVPRPKEIILDPDTIEHTKLIELSEIRGTEGAYSYQMIGPRSFFGNFNYFKDELESLLTSGQNVTICAGSTRQKERLSQMIASDRVSVIEQSFSCGFSLPQKRLIVICEHEIFGRRKQLKKTHYHYKSTPLDSFIDLNPGDLVVHVNYGIGRFAKIDRIKASGKERDYIDIEYAGDDHVFIPIEQANLIQRYIGSDSKAPKLDTLGGKSWDARKQKARKSAEDLANMLIELYAKRKNTPGFPFPKDNDWQLQFEASFPYEETEDQLTCINEIKQDMESPLVMDRLICGDVGYGKTEVAIRAAFKAVMGGRQVAFLAPTTILAEQHYDTIIERLGSFPVAVGMLSRFVDKKEQKQTVQRFNERKIDILVGTHRIIQKDIDFSSVGLMIVDEEQRFGVKDKERIKQLKTSVDSLALSATPIPRTLYMSLLKIRDMSLLATAPFQRRPIQTSIEEFDSGIIADAIRREVSRGGQVFFLHNRVKTLPEIQMLLEQIVPEVTIDYAHGQMDADRIEQTMRNFIHGNFQVLVATTIIENGIDIPNVNTIIIDRADIYGISQLYQLRGRVGRSDKEAYALLLYPSRHVLSEIAMKRLKILSEHTELGSGFKIAMKDMEIRGAGNLLGRQQHGQMAAVGLDMYMRILDEAIAELSEDERERTPEVYLDLDYSGYIPDSYITDPSIKFDIYKKIASITTAGQLLLLEAELEDRFGRMPEDMRNLLYIAELKTVCRSLSVFHLQERNGVVQATFSKVADIKIERVLDMITQSRGEVSIDQKRPNVLLLKTEAVSLKDKSLFILEKLQRLL